MKNRIRYVIQFWRKKYRKPVYCVSRLFADGHPRQGKGTRLKMYISFGVNKGGVYDFVLYLFKKTLRSEIHPGFALDTGLTIQIYIIKKW